MKTSDEIVDTLAWAAGEKTSYLDMTPDVDLRHLRYFVAVAEELSFTRAAQRLRMAQPPLSQQIRRLEEQVGVPLFERSPRVRLTEAGVALLEVARLTLAQVERGLDAAGRIGRGEAGRLTVGMTSSVVFTTIPDAFRVYAARYPAVELRLREMHTAPQIDALRAGTIDVGLLREAPDIEDLESEVLVREPFVVLVPKGHPLATKGPVAPRDLAGERFVLFPRSVAPALYDQIAAICRSANFSPRVRHEALEWETLTGLVGAGLGVSIAPASVRRLRWRGVVYRPLTGTSARTSIVVCRRRAPVAATVEGFVQILRGVAAKAK